MARTRAALLLVTSLLATRARAAAPRWHELSEDQVFAENARLHREIPFLADRLAAVSERLLGAAYAPDPVGEGPEGEYDRDPLLDLRRADESSFLEQALALALRPGKPEALEVLRRLRYGAGKEGFLERRRFPESDWIPGAVAGGWARDIAQELAPEAARAAGTASPSRWFARLSTSAVQGAFTPEERRRRLAALRAAGGRLQDRKVSLAFLPAALIEESLPRIPPGTLIFAVRAGRPDKAPSVSHRAILARKDGEAVLRGVFDGRPAEEVPAAEFLKRLSGGRAPISGIAVFEPADPSPPRSPLHPRRSTEPVVLVWPPEGYAVSAAGQYLLGSVSDATASLKVNGQTVPVHPGGGFIAWSAVAPGTFTFRAELALDSGTASAERTIQVSPAKPPPLPGPPQIDEASLLPKADALLGPGDWVQAQMRATPGLRAQARLGRKGPWRPLREAGPGVYQATWRLEGGSEPAAPIEYRLGEGWGALKAKSAGTVAPLPEAPLVATIKPSAAGFVNLKATSANGSFLFPAAGTRLLVTGREGGSLRVRLAEGLEGWIDAKDAEAAPAAAAPRPLADTVSVTASSSMSVVRVALSERAVVSGEILPGGSEALFRLHGAVSAISWVIHDPKDDLVEEARWSQEPGALLIRVRARPGRRFWGWHAAYGSAGSTLRLELRRPPRIDPRRPLLGVRVMVDPGHMPSQPGDAVGPLGTREMDANDALALAASHRLRREGAVVLLTRASPSDEVSLVDRPKLALQRGADLFVSLHNNALPDSANPFAKPHGFIVFYHHPHSHALAEAVHAAYREASPLPDEGLWWGNLLVARLSAVPAILVENACLTYPEQEALLNEPAFRAKLADALVSGLKAFLLEAGERDGAPARGAGKAR